MLFSFPLFFFKVFPCRAASAAFYTETHCLPSGLGRERGWWPRLASSMERSGLHVLTRWTHVDTCGHLLNLSIPKNYRFTTIYSYLWPIVRSSCVIVASAWHQTLPIGSSWLIGVTISPDLTLALLLLNVAHLCRYATIHIACVFGADRCVHERSLYKDWEHAVKRWRKQAVCTRGHNLNFTWCHTHTHKPGGLSMPYPCFGHLKSHYFKEPVGSSAPAKGCVAGSAQLQQVWEMFAYVKILWPMALKNSQYLCGGYSEHALLDLSSVWLALVCTWGTEVKQWGPDSLSTLQRCIEQSCAQLVKERLRELKLVLVEPGAAYCVLKQH